MAGVRQHIPLGLGVPDQVLPHDALLAQHFHREQLARLLLLHQVHLPEAATPQDLQRDEVRRAHLLIVDGLVIAVGSGCGCCCRRDSDRVFTLLHHHEMIFLRSWWLLLLGSLSLGRRVHNRCKFLSLLDCNGIL